jgi:hypothetical protein
MEIKDFVYIGVVVVGAMAAIFSDRWQNRQNQKDIEELKKSLDNKVVEKDDYDREIERIKEINTLQWKKLDEYKDWQINHEREAAEKVSGLDIKIAVLNGAHEKLAAMLGSIEKKLDELIVRIGK